MNTSNPSTTQIRSLTKQQLQILTTLYKFRFTTAELIATSQGTKYKRVILARLKILEGRGYIGKHYDKSYKLAGKPASYFLLARGIRALREQSFASEKALKRMYYDKTQDDIHIAHRLNVFKTYIYFKHHYLNQFQFYSKTELSTWQIIPVPRDLSDAYLRRQPNSNNPTKAGLELKDQHYLLSYYEASSKSWRIRNSINRYIAYAETEVWQQKTSQDFPTILLICENEQLKHRVQRMADRAKDSSYVNLHFICYAI